MFLSLFKSIYKGGVFIKNNPQVLYTLFLMFAIPLAFIYTGQRFLDVSVKNQERLEKERIGLMHDVFVSSIHIVDHLKRENHPFLQDVVDKIVEKNPNITAFKVVLRKNGKNIVVASNNKDEIGQDDTENELFYGMAGAQLNDSIIYPVIENGERHWKAVRSILDEEKNVRGFVFTDISMATIDRVAAQNIRKAYWTLFFIIIAISVLLFRQARIIDYAQLYKKLKEVDKMKDDFISMAAHELKTPLAAIRGYVSLIDTSRLSDEDKEGVARINESIERLNTLIGDILDVARIQQGRMKFSFEDVEPSEIIASVVDSFRLMAKEKALVLEYQKTPLPKIHIDPKRFEQVLINLIGNALKYTPRGSVRITTEVEKSFKGNDMLHIRVSDTGVGISADDQKKLFKRFSRIRTRKTANIGGTGLGLWITAKIVATMGETIKVEYIEGKGSDFIISKKKKKNEK